MELRVCYDVCSDHWPQVRFAADLVKRLEPAVVIFVVVFPKRNERALHLLLLLAEPLDDVFVFEGRHWHVEHVDVVVVDHVHTVLEVPGLGCVCNKFKIGV